jgi:hypothetical protein
MGSGMGDWVWSLEVHDGGLLVGGQFTEAGGKGAYYIGRWDDPLVSVPEAPIAGGALMLVAGYPNPFASSTTIRYNLPTSGFVRLGIFDVLGRRVATLVEGVQPAGWNSAVWSGLDTRGNSAPAGVYFALIEHGAALRAQKIVLVK